MSGGLRGSMEAACRGAAEAGGLVVGVLPKGTRRGANRFVNLPLPTGMGYARNYLVVRFSEVVVSVGESPGTLNEMAFAVGERVPIVGFALHDNPLGIPVETKLDEVMAFVESALGRPT